MYGVDANQNSDVKKWLEVHQKVEQLGKVAMAELEDDLRRLLGDLGGTKTNGGAEVSSAESDH